MSVRSAATNISTTETLFNRFFMPRIVAYERRCTKSLIAKPGAIYSKYLPRPTTIAKSPNAIHAINIRPATNRTEFRDRQRQIAVNHPMSENAGIAPT
jgi:hypothetical protein